MRYQPSALAMERRDPSRGVRKKASFPSLKFLASKMLLVGVEELGSGKDGANGAYSSAGDASDWLGRFTRNILVQTFSYIGDVADSRGIRMPLVRATLFRALGRAQIRCWIDLASRWSHSAG